MINKSRSPIVELHIKLEWGRSANSRHNTTTKDNSNQVNKQRDVPSLSCHQTIINPLGENKFLPLRSSSVTPDSRSRRISSMSKVYLKCTKRRKKWFTSRLRQTFSRVEPKNLACQPSHDPVSVFGRFLAYSRELDIRVRRETLYHTWATHSST
jgi:hypothetical protein